MDSKLRTDPTYTVSWVKEIIARYRFRYATEKELQEGLARAFEECQIPAHREHSLSASDTIDFLLPDRVGVEVKIGGSLADVTRQLHRYAQHDQVATLVLITTRSAHEAAQGVLCGKKVHVEVIRGAFQ